MAHERGFLYPQWGLIVISVALCLVSSRTWAFLPNAATGKRCCGELPRHDICTSRTELSMGIRDFLSRRRKGGDKKPDPDKEPFKPPPRPEKPKAVVPPAPKKQLPISPPPTPSPVQSKPLRMGEDPSTGLISAKPRVPGTESASDRIQRLKSGQMTPEEKQAFMQTALSTGNTPESRLPLRNSPDRRGQPNENASPFPKDSIMRNIARGGKPPAPADLENITANQKKQEYLDMVTNPNRFGAYRSGTIAPAKQSEEAADDEEEDDKEIEDNNSKLPQDLGARLGAAAMAKERQMAENRRLAQEREKMMEEQRREFNKRVAKEQRLRQEEMARREAELLQKKKEEEAEKKRLEEERKKQEEQRLQEMQKAQDSYWASKLAKEKEEKVTKDVVVSTGVSGKKVEEENTTAKATPEPVEKVSAEPTVEAPKPMFSFGSKSNSQPKKEEQSPQLPYDFKSEQIRKKEVLDRQRDEQLAKLKALNSPLPSPVPPKASQAGPSAPQKVFQPQFPAGNKPRAPVQTLANIAPPPRKSEPVEQAVDRSLSISELTKGKKPPPSKKINPDNPWSRLVGGKPKQEPKPVSKAVVQPPPPSRPIRMELPVDDVEEEDDDDFYLDKGMTIGQIMNKKNNADDQEARSKQWGVDMSRFMD